MKYALLNGTPVEATWAVELSGDAFAEIRTLFSCVGCNAHAYLNKGSPHQGAYFASKNHAEDCDEAYQGDSGSDAAIVQASTIVVVLGNRGESSNELPTTSRLSTRRRTTISKGDVATGIPARRRVDAILQELLVNPEFATSSKKIVVGKVETLASEFFVPFDQLGLKHIDRVIGVWGEAFSFRERTSIVFLNRGDQKIDIRIPQSIFSQLKKHYQYTSDEQINGAKFLLIGTFNFLMECHISDVTEIALQKKNM
jgi:hypothetical protein